MSHRGPQFLVPFKTRRILFALAAVLGGCSGGSDAPSGPVAPPPPPPPPPPAVGDLSVTVATTGQDTDPDGYTLTLDGSETRTVGANSTTTFTSLSPGSHTVDLDGIYYNCAVDGANPQAANVTAGATAEVSFSVGCLFIEGKFDFDVAANVPQTEIDVIEGGLDLATAFLDSDLEGGIPRRVRDTITVKIVATGRGNEEPGGEGACCTAFSISSTGDLIVRPFFDVAHNDWVVGNPTTLDRSKIAIHEYAHGWHQAIDGRGRPFREPPIRWLQEGGAEYIAYEALIWRGDMSRATARARNRQHADNTGVLNRPLQDFEGNVPGIWPGHVGYIAVDMLIHQYAPQGLLSLRRLCEAIASGQTEREAFETAFGIPLADFYAEFEVWRQSPPPPPPPDVTPPNITLRGITGLDASNAQQVSLVLDGKVVDRNGDGTAVTSATVQVTIEGPLPGMFDGVCGTGDEFDKFQDVLVTPPNNPAATDLVIVDVTGQVNANDGDFSVTFTAQNQGGNLGLGDYTYCFEIVADDGAKRKDGTDDGLAVSSFGGKDFTWQ